MSGAPHDLSTWLPMPDDLGLSPQHVDVWQCPVDVSPEMLGWFAALLVDAERQRAGRMRIAAKQNESIVSRGLLRYVLGRTLQTDPHEFVFDFGPHGKPSLQKTWQNQPVGFNVSHTHNRVLIAAALGRDLGVDVEHVRPRIDYEGLARRFFAPAEYAALAAVPDADRLAAFFTCWTRKEAVLKATGRGIALGLGTFEVSVRPTDPAAILRGQDPASPARWALQDLPIGPGYVAALAMEGHNAPIRLWVLPEEK